MYHIFYIHSHTTYLISRAIIAQSCLDERRIVFVFCRGFQTNDSFEDSLVLDFENSQKIEVFRKVWYKYMLISNSIEKWDEFVRNNIVGSYSLYVPQFAHLLMQIMASNKSCSRISLIEEGANCYSSNLLLRSHNSPIKRIVKEMVNVLIHPFYKGRVRFNDIFDVKHYKEKLNLSESYSISDKGFSGLSLKKKVVDLSILVKKVQKNSEFENEVILILEAAVDQGNLNEVVFVDALKVLVMDYSQKIHIKFHPSQTRESRLKIINVFEVLKRPYSIISDSISMEEIFLSYMGLQIVGFSSSLLFYARCFGHSVKSYEYLLLSDPKFKKFRANNNYQL